MFVEEELFEGNNLYRCAQCDRLVTAAKVGVKDRHNNTFIMFITMLIIQLFVFSPSSCCSYVVCQTQETPSVLDRVSAEIQLRLCQMRALQGNRTLHLPAQNQPPTIL